jgi:hypothetical protein
MTEQSRAPASYDPLKTGKCFDEGVPLFWRNACIGYNIHNPPSRKISYDDAADLLSTAFTRWTGATCPTVDEQRSRVSIDVRDLGPASCDRVEHVSGASNQNIVLFRDDDWRHDKSVLGLTTVKYNPETGELYGADMEINMVDAEPLALSGSADGAYDFLSIATHEAGHFLGMAHSDVKGATMTAEYHKGETFQRVLSPDDIAGLCTVYRPDGYRAVLSDKVFQAPECNPTPRGGFSRECEKAPGRTCSLSPSRHGEERASWTAAVVLSTLLLLRKSRGGA